MPNFQTKIGERKQKKQREINREISLVDYVEKINKNEITNYDTVDVDIAKLAKNNTEVRVEYDHAKFQIRQLKKNGHLTHYGKCQQVKIIFNLIFYSRL